MTIFITFDEAVEPSHEKHVSDGDDSDFNENLYRSVEELELSVRSANCLKNADIHKIFQLVSKTEAEMLKTKNFPSELNSLKITRGKNFIQNIISAQQLQVKSQT